VISAECERAASESSRQICKTVFWQFENSPRQLIFSTKQLWRQNNAHKEITLHKQLDKQLRRSWKAAFLVVIAAQSTQQSSLPIRGGF
jgi:hypothetical protein